MELFLIEHFANEIIKRRKIVIYCTGFNLLPQNSDLFNSLATDILIALGL